MNPDKLILCECLCEPDVPYADGSLPNFYENVESAIEGYVLLRRQNSLYFGAHFQGQHILGIKK
jgi:hypothetical protein